MNLFVLGHRVIGYTDLLTVSSCGRFGSSCKEFQRLKSVKNVIVGLLKTYFVQYSMNRPTAYIRDLKYVSQIN